MRTRKRPLKDRTAPGEASFNNLFSIYKISARKRSISFLLTKDEFNSIVVRDCYYCGAAPVPYNKYYNRAGTKQFCMARIFPETAERQWIKVNGVDRLKSDADYRMDNCVPCCAKCNYFKLDSSETEFLQHVHKISDHQRGIK